MSAIIGNSQIPPLETLEDMDGNLFRYAKFHDASANATVAKGDVGWVTFDNGGARFEKSSAFAVNQTWAYPGVAASGGKVGDQISVQVYGQVEATFPATIDTRTHKGLQIGGATITAAASPVDNLRWGTVVGAGANSTKQTVFLAGSPSTQ